MTGMVLWVSLSLLITASALPKKHMIYRFLVGGAGWIFFALHWATQSSHYLEIVDYVNVVLVLLFAIFCIFIGITMMKLARKLHDSGDNASEIGEIKEGNEIREGTEGNERTEILEMNEAIQTRDMSTLLTLTRATAISGLFYFPFANIAFLNTWIISMVTDQTVWLSELFGFGVIRVGWDLIELNGLLVQIILACTAIESIALFSGLIFSVKAPGKRVLKAFLVSIPVIYSLNIIRDAFVLVAYGEAWFGEESFYIAHHVLAKAGSGIALLGISYVVLKTLPELLDMIEGIFNLVKKDKRSSK